MKRLVIDAYCLGILPAKFVTALFRVFPNWKHK